MQSRPKVDTWDRLLELQDAINAYLEHHNRNPKPFIWTKTADQILESVASARKFKP